MFHNFFEKYTHGTHRRQSRYLLHDIYRFLSKVHSFMNRKERDLMNEYIYSYE